MDLVSLRLHGKKTRGLTPDELGAVRAWYAQHQWCAPDDNLNATIVAPPRSSMADDKVSRVPIAQLDTFWRRCLPLDAADPNDPHVRAALKWIEERQYDLGALISTGLARITPPADKSGAYPPWWPPGRRRRWPLVTLLWEPTGEMAGLHGRGVMPGEEFKTLNPKGNETTRYKISGSLMMNRQAWQLASSSTPAPELEFALVCEGLTDFWRAASVLNGRSVAVFGAVAGSFSCLADIPWPRDLLVYVATDTGDSDGTGDKYAARARAALGDRFRRVVLPHKKDLDDIVRTEADLMDLLNNTGPRESLLSLSTRLQDVPASERRVILGSMLMDPQFIAGLGELHRNEPGTLRGAAIKLAALQGLSKSDANAIQAAAREASRGVVGPGAEEAHRPTLDQVLSSVLDGHPIPFGLTEPPNWRVRPGGVYQVKGDENPPARVASSPLLITGRLANVATNSIDLVLEWIVPGFGWTSAVVSRGTVASNRALISLAQVGAPINSGNAGALVKYLADFEAHNSSEIPLARSSPKMGWQQVGSEVGFLVGRRYYTRGGVIESPPGMSPTLWPAGYLHLDDGNGEYAHVVDAYRMEGSREKWLEALELVRGCPKVLLGLYAAMVPPLLKFLPELGNFAIEWVVDTSLGKTTTLRLIASFWGSSRENDPATCLMTWDNSRVYVERRAAIVTHTPLVLDDTKKASNPRDVGETIYRVEGGQGRGRGSVTGIQATVATWSTVLVSSGEEPSSTIGRSVKGRANGGASARILSVAGIPLGEESEAMAALAGRFKALLVRNFGHGADLLCRWLVSEDRGPWIRETFDRYYAHWLGVAGDNGVATRAAGYLAVLTVARDIAAELYNGSLDDVDALNEAWAAALASVEDADLGGSALRYVASWAASNEGRFFGRASGGAAPPYQGWAGAWQDETWLKVLPSVLDEALMSQGYSPAEVLRVWRRRGWLKHRKGRFTWPGVLGRSRTEMIHIRLSVLEAAPEEG